MEISHTVYPLRQPHLNDCWATATAMVLRMQGPDAVAHIKRRAARVHLNRNGSIPAASVPELARTLNLRSTNLQNPPQSLNPTNLSQVLRASCAAAFGSYNYPGVPTSTDHVLVFYRLSGPDNNPMVYFVDPYTARRFNYLVSEINEALGSVDYFLHQ